MGVERAEAAPRVPPLLLVCVAAIASGFPADAGAQESRTDSATIDWQDLPALPNSVGLGGPFAGRIEKRLLVAGGANFPLAPPWEGGEKVWHREAYVLERGARQWRPVAGLPRAGAYGASLSTEIGLVLLGGEDATGVFDDVHLVREEASSGGIRYESLPPLPQPSSYLAAGLLGKVIYVLPGQRSKDPSDLVDEFWRLDLSLPPKQRAWERLDDFPGVPRIKAVAAVQAFGHAGERLLFLSGELPERGAGGQIQRRYLDDAWSYEPRSGWQELAPLPRPAAAGSALAVGQSHVLVLSGDEGRNRELPLQERPQFNDEILAYHTVTDQWLAVGTMAQPVVTTAVVAWQDRHVVVSGEIRPGVRTPRVQTLKLEQSSLAFGWWNAVVLGGYLVLLVALGFWCSKRSGTTRDFFVAGGRIPWWAAGLSIYATQLSAITFIATPAVAFTSNWLLLPSWFLILLFAPLVIRCYLPFFRRLGCTTAYEYLERRFHVAVRSFGSASFVVYQLARMAIVVFLPALMLSTISGLNIHLCILVMGILATLYTTLGGIEAVVWTDVLQVVVLIGGLIFGLILLIDGSGGLAECFAIARGRGRLQVLRGGWSLSELATWSVLLGAFFLQFGPYTTDQAVVQRYLTTKDEGSAARGIWMNGLMSVPFAMLFLLVGAALYAYYSTRPEELALGMQNDAILPLFVARELPPGLSGLVIAGIFAASMSSLDSSMHSIATAIATDFRGRFGRRRSDEAELRWARRATLLVGAVGTLLSLVLASMDVRSLFFLFQECLGLLVSGLAGIFILGVFTRRASWRGALIGATAGTLMLVWISFFTNVHEYLYAAFGIPCTVIVGYLASLFLPDRSKNLAGLTFWTMHEVRSS